MLKNAQKPDFFEFRLTSPEVAKLDCSVTVLVNRDDYSRIPQIARALAVLLRGVLKCEVEINAQPCGKPVAHSAVMLRLNDIAQRFYALLAAYYVTALRLFSNDE